MKSQRKHGLQSIMMQNLMPDLNGVTKVNCLTISASGVEGEELLGIPKIGAGTEKEQANAIYEILKNVKLIS